MRSQKLQREKVNFKITRNEIGKYSPSSVDLNGVTDEFLAKYTDWEIEKAKELKAKQKALHEADPNHVDETAYSDAYYLDYAKTLTHEEHASRRRAIFKNNLGGCDIKDLEWAQYSYEEILQMEQDGYKIPLEVIEWAHSQQQADVTDYVVVSDNAEGEDYSATEDVTGSDELTKLRTQALNDIARIEKAEKETDKEIEEYSRTRSQAKAVQARTAFFQDMEFKKLEEKTNEWKKLNAKKEAGKLNKLEEKRFNKLTQELKGSDSGIVAKLEANAAELDEFLGQIDKINVKIADNEEVIAKATQDATALSSIERQYAPSRLPVPINNIRINVNGLSTSTLYGIRTDDISTITLEKGKDLDATDVHLTNRIQSSKTQKLVTFASEYSEKVQNATGQTKEAIGETAEGSSDKAEDKENPQNEEPKEKYTVEKEFSAQNSLQATETTLASTADMISAQVKAIKEEKNLKKETEQAQKDLEALEQEASSVQAQHNANLSQEEIFLMQLDELNASQEEAPAVQPAEETEENVQPQAPVAPVQEDNSSEKIALAQSIASVQEDDAALTSGVVTAAEKSQASTARSKMFANVLRSEAATFEQARKTTTKVAAQTAVVGIGTVARGVVDSVVGSDMIVTGSILVNSIYPPTVIAGMGLLTAGTMLYAEGFAELTSGALATGVGYVSTGTAMAAEVITKEIAGVNTTAQAEIQSNQASITEAEASVGIETNVEVDTTGNNEAPAPVSEEPEAVSAEEPEALVEAPVVQTPAPTAQTAEVTKSEPEQANPEAVKPAQTTSQSTAAKTTSSEAQTEKAQNNPLAADEKDNKEKDNNVGKTQNSATETLANKNETQSNSQSTEVDETKASEEPKAREAYDVKQDFSIIGAAAATATTIKASSDVLSSRDDAHNTEAAFNSKLSMIRKMNESIDKNRDLAEAITQQQAQKAAQTKAQIETENENIQKAAEQGDVETFEQGQTNVHNLAGAMQDEAAAGVGKFSSNISSLNDSIDTVQNDRANLKSELVDFNKKIDEQLDVSQKTLVVGAGTFGVGFARGFAGELMYELGMSLEATAGINVAQHVLAAVMIIQGAKMVIQGGLEEKAGITAAATGSAGLITHTAVKGDKIDIDQNEKTGTSFLTVTRNRMKRYTAEVQEQNAAGAASIEEVNLIAASATANANSVDKAETDDKAEKKLARFNKETEIESRKKRKRVNAVSASARG